MPFQSCYIRIKIAASGLVVFPSPQPPKPPRKSYSMNPAITNVHEGLQAVYEDPDALRVNTEPGWQRWLLLVSAGESPKHLVCLWQPAFTDGNQTEVIVRPVPRPRSRLPSKPDVLNPRTNDGVEVTHSSSSVVRRPLATHAPTPHGLCHMMFQPMSCCQDFHIYEYPTEGLGRLRPVRPPPKPPVSRPGASDKPTAPLGRSGPSSSLNSEEVFGLCWIFHLTYF